MRAEAQPELRQGISESASSFQLQVFIYNKSSIAVLNCTAAGFS